MQPTSVRNTHPKSSPAPASGAPNIKAPIPAVEGIQSSRVVDSTMKFSSSSYPRLKEGCSRALFTLCNRSDGYYTYADDLTIVASRVGTTVDRLLDAARTQLENGELHVDARGNIFNPHSLGSEFGMVVEFLTSRVDIHFVVDRQQLALGNIPFSTSYGVPLAIALSASDSDEAITVLLVKTPPRVVREEIRRILDSNCGGVSLWLDRRRHFQDVIGEPLQAWLDNAAIQITHTGSSHLASNITTQINEHLEVEQGFKRKHVARLVHEISANAHNESLIDVLKICAPVVVSIKVLEHVLPGALHIVGGVFDDLFGAIIPDVSQSISKNGTLWQKVKQGSMVFLGGSIGLPFSFAFGYISVRTYATAQTAIERGMGGAFFALACCAGAVGTSVAAVAKAYKVIKNLEVKVGEDSGFFKRLWTAFDEAILKVPFRVGHTLIGLPAQLVLGVAVGMLELFHSSIFVTVEGVLETVIGAAFAFLYPKLATHLHDRKLKDL